MAQFEDLVAIVRKLENREVQPGEVSGELRVDTADILVALQRCEADSENAGVELMDPTSITSVTVGSTIQIQIKTPRPGFGLLSPNIDALLCYPKAHVKEPRQPFYLLDTEYYSGDQAHDDHVVLAYRAVLDFVGMLRSCAAFLDEEEEVLVFIKEGKFDVPVNYTGKDLISVSIESLTALTEIIPDGTHEKQCSSIMGEAVYELTAKLPSHLRFASLLEQAQELKARFEKGYELFAAGFSYEKIRDEIEAARVEYAGKIHKILSDIQNQLLAIPVATIIVATQMKESMRVDANFWMSLAVLAGSFVFMLLMHFLLRNQRQTLEVIGIEIKRQKSRLEKEHAAIAENFADTFRSLESRYKTQRRVLLSIDGVVVGGFLLSVYFFYNLTQPAQQFLRELIK
jgi:hypothetical protein